MSELYERAFERELFPLYFFREIRGGMVWYDDRI